MTTQSTTHSTTMTSSMTSSAKAHAKGLKYALQRRGIGRDKIEFAARFGWAARGALYLLLGGLAVMAAVGEGGGLHDGKGVMQWVLSLPMGQVLVGFAGLGFAGYSLYRFVVAIVGPDSDSDSTLKEIASRVHYFITACIYGSLAVAAVQLLMGEQSSASGGKRFWIAQALEQSWGPALIGAIGVGVMAFGLWQFKHAVTDNHEDNVRAGEMSRREKQMFVWAGRIGYSARGVVMLIIGYFTLQAALQASPDQSKGVDGALQQIAQEGWLPLAAIALGLVAYGVLQLFYARYRKVEIS